MAQRFALGGLATGGPSPSQRGAMRLEIETARFTAELRRFAARLNPAMQRDVLVANGLDLLRRVQMRTPVRTSRAKNSLHFVPPDTAADAFRYTDAQGRSFDGNLAEGTGPLEALVGGNVVYLLPLEAGSSRQAPAGMFAVSLAEKRGHLERDADRVLREEWGR